MESLLDLLSQQAPNLQTRKALVLLGLQNDILEWDAKFPVDPTSGFTRRIKDFVPAFRRHGKVIWVRTGYKEKRVVNDPSYSGCSVVMGETVTSCAAQQSSTGSQQTPRPLHERTRSDYSSTVPAKRAKTSARPLTKPAKDALEADDNFEDSGAEELEKTNDDEGLILNKSADRTPCYIVSSHGAQHPEYIKTLIDGSKDIQIIKSSYSAFSGSHLLITLRARLVTELFIGGCMTNLSVYATAMDAARHGIKVTLVSDCLGYHRRNRHDSAIKQLVEIMDARVLSSDEVLRRLEDPLLDNADEGYKDQVDNDEVEEAVKTDGKRGLHEGPEAADPQSLVRLALASRQDISTLPVRQKSSGRISSLLASKPDDLPSAQHAKPTSPGPPDANNIAVRSRSRGNDIQGRLDAGGVGQHSSVTWTSGDSLLTLSESTPDVGAKAKRIRSSGLSGVQRDRSSSQRPSQPSARRLCTKETASEAERQRSSDVEQCTDVYAPQGVSPADFQIATGKSVPVFGAEAAEESQCSTILDNLLPPDLASTIFKLLYNEVQWQRMYHAAGEVPRLVCCQGDVATDGSMPVYRHPSDHSPPLLRWTESVMMVRQAAERHVGHPLNHVLIQLYRCGNDFISEHSDKTLDVVPGSNIVNVSFGAERKMRLRTKRSAPGGMEGRTTYRVPMPHNSMLTMSLATNAKYLHGILADKRLVFERSTAELAYGGMRISLTFRQIGTFLSADGKYIWGQGAMEKRREEAKKTVNGNARESQRMIDAFGAENQASTLEWETFYGRGFDVLHLKAETAGSASVTAGEEREAEMMK